MPSKPKKSNRGDPRPDPTWTEQFKELAGFSWPPGMDPAEWGIVLLAAGWDQERIEEFFRNELALEDIVMSSEWPAFSANLLAGLGRWRYMEFLNEWRCSSDLKETKNRSKTLKRVLRLIEITKDSEQAKALQHEQKVNEIHTWLHRITRGELKLGTNESGRIPIEHRSRGLTYGEAARYHSGRTYKNPSAYIQLQIENKSLTAPLGDGRLKQYDIRDFPPGCHSELRDPPTRRPKKTSAT